MFTIEVITGAVLVLDVVGCLFRAMKGLLFSDLSRGKSALPKQRNLHYTLKLQSVGRTDIMRNEMRSRRRIRDQNLFAANPWYKRCHNGHHPQSKS